MNDDVHTHRPDAVDLRRFTVIVSGHVGSPRSSVGLSLARILHMPCIDIANAGIGSSNRPPLDPHDHRIVAERRWVKTMIGSDFGRVVVVPCTALDLVTGRRSPGNTWTAWLDVHIDHLVRQARNVEAGVDIDALHRHVRETRRLAGSCDDVIDTNGHSADVIAERLSVRCRADLANAHDGDATQRTEPPLPRDAISS